MKRFGAMLRGFAPALVCSLPLMLAGCKQAAEAPAAEQPKANLQVSTVHLENDVDVLDIPGRVEVDPEHLVHVYAPLSGRLLNLTLTPGQEVRKGQTIAMLESGDVAQARSDFEKARIETLRADRALTRGQVLIAHEVMSDADFQELKAADDAAHAEQERARQRVHELGFSENGTSDVTAITAPITGTVLDVGTASGEMQRSLETSNGIATIANLDTIWVTGDLYEQDLGIVHAHEPVEILLSAYPGEVMHGVIDNVGDSLDPATHAVKARVVVANPEHRLKPEMFTTLRIVRPGQMRILVPIEAILHDGDKTVAYVQGVDGKYNATQVKTGATHGKLIEVLSGLTDGERVVTEGAAFLRQPVGD
jgi:membrane fusion protein, heavy metal efflux system